MLDRDRSRQLAFFLPTAALMLAVPVPTAASLFMACAPVRPAPPAQTGRRKNDDPSDDVDILILAPHPDDESIMTAGVIARAHAEGRRVAVSIVTNGDLTCERDGYLRERETVAAMRRLGLAEKDVYFLGYPDGYLDALGDIPLRPLDRRTRDGRCVAGNTTYGGHGFGHTDVHSLVTGAPAPYTAESLTFDVAALLDRLHPRDVFVSHPIDEHPDHAMVYSYLRRALERRDEAPPRIHRSLVHIGGCWPTAPGLPPCADVRFTPTLAPPLLPPPLDTYVPNELVPVPDSMLASERERNTKFLAIAEYVSQTGPTTGDLSYLFSFARSKEGFFTETLVSDGQGRHRRAPAPGASRGLVESAGTWHAEGKGSRRALAQRAPLRCRIEDAASESAFDFLGSAEGRYTLRTRANELTLERWSSEPVPLVLRRWYVPKSPAAERHDLEIAVDLRPDDGNVGEITVRRDGQILGVEIDPTPLRVGNAIAIANAKTSGVACEPY